MTRGRPFQHGNKFGPRFQKGTSGNPAGLPQLRREFEQAFNEALISRGSPEKAADLLWAAAGEKGESWEGLALLQRLAPETKNFRLEVSHDGDGIDYSRLNDEQFRALGEILELARVEPLALPEGSGAAEHD